MYLTVATRHAGQLKFSINLWQHFKGFFLIGPINSISEMWGWSYHVNMTLTYWYSMSSWESTRESPNQHQLIGFVFDARHNLFSWTYCPFCCRLGLCLAIAILTVYKQFFWYLNFANHRTKESFVLTANKPLVSTLTTIGDVTVSIAIAHSCKSSSIIIQSIIWSKKDTTKSK